MEGILQYDGMMDGTNLMDDEKMIGKIPTANLHGWKKVPQMGGSG